MELMEVSCYHIGITVRYLTNAALEDIKAAFYNFPVRVKEVSELNGVKQTCTDVSEIELPPTGVDREAAKDILLNILELNNIQLLDDYYEYPIYDLQIHLSTKAQDKLNERR